MSSTGERLKVAPVSDTANIWPVWTNLVDNWRAEDAHWLRDRSIQIFANAAARNTALAGHTLFGMLSILQTGGNGPDFWNAAGAWESIRYPLLDVVSDSSSITVRRLTAGSGVRLFTDGHVEMSKAIIGAGGIGATIDNTGISLKVGTKTVKLSTDTNWLLVDSPLAVTGALSINGAATITGTVSVSSLTTPGAVAAASVTASGAVVGATVQGTTSVRGANALLGTTGVLATLKNAAGGTSQLGVGSDSTVRIDGSTLTAALPATFSNDVTVVGATHFQGRPTLEFPGTTAVWVAGIFAAPIGNSFPSTVPDGTIGILY